MMADAYHPGVETSIDLVRKHRFHTTSIAGTKRASDQCSTDVQPTLQHRQPVLPPPRLQASSISAVTLLHGDTEAAELSEYSQRKSLASTPGPNQNPLLSLRHSRYGIPKPLALNFESLGVCSIYPWQSACLLGKGVLSGDTNLVYTAPTGGGKSLVADVLLMKRIIEDPTRKAILVLPYVALIQEKLKWLRKLVEGVTKNMDVATTQAAAANPVMHWKTPQSHIRVAGFFGGSRARMTWADIDIAVCTIEKVGPALLWFPASPDLLQGKCSG